MTDRIAELRELEKAATPGPWRGVHDRYVGNAPPETNWCAAIFAPDPTGEKWDEVTIMEADCADKHIDFIVAMHNALPALLDVVEAARAVDERNWRDHSPEDDTEFTETCRDCALHDRLAALDGAE